MQGQGVLFGQIAVVFGIVFAGVWAATQWTAAALGYQVRLGSPWFDFLHTPVYHPWRLFEWWFLYDGYAPRIFDKGGAIAGGSGLVAVLVAIAMSVWRSRQSKLVTTYGSARWAEAADIRKAGLDKPVGVFLGLHRGQYLRHEGPEHVLTFAPTRSGKGVGLVVPTLLSWPASAVIHDIKGENWQITAGWRSRFSHCLLFNPTDPKSAAYNPLLEVRRGAHEVRDVQNIADILVDPEGGTTRYSETGCSDAMRSAMRQSQREVTSATVGSRYSPRNDMAVESTPERSLSALLSTSRAAEATTGCGASPKCLVVIIRCKVSSNGHAGSERKLATPRRVLSSLA